MHFSSLSIVFTLLATSLSHLLLLPFLLELSLRLHLLLVSSSTTPLPGTTLPTDCHTTRSGDATYFDAGLGACGGTNGNWEYVVALNVPQWNGGANCWRGITIQAYGKQINAAIVDQCPGCGYGSLDLTPSLFQAFTSLDVGRVPVNDFPDDTESDDKLDRTHGRAAGKE
ncbi:RlpA-like double-psi beta-barrel-protein domain-containing protein-containing protein [Rhizoctonia solani]|nr:RlpA-like double-psi beta-barrel-protein domain-containing protein-containing protein [Rhizoctonia solani]